MENQIKPTEFAPAKELEYLIRANDMITELRNEISWANHDVEKRLVDDTYVSVILTDSEDRLQLSSNALKSALKLGWVAQTNIRYSKKRGVYIALFKKLDVDIISNMVCEGCGD